MEFLRQLTFENTKWTKNFDNFETVDDFLDEDGHDLDNGDDTPETTVDSIKNRKKKITKQSITKQNVDENGKHVPIVLIKRFNL